MPDISQWDTCALWRQLDPLLPGLSIEVVERTASTNTLILERARVVQRQDAAQAVVRRSVESAAFGRRAADLQPCLLVAEHQTAGRGRQGRVWRSAPGASLTFSLALPLRLAEWSGLSLAVGVALADALEPAPQPGAHEAPPARIGLKWPNDLWLIDGTGVGRKLGGILIETVAAGASRLAIIGIGLNVLPVQVSDASSGVACLQELDAALSAPAALHRVALPLVSALRQFEREGFAPFRERFDARDLLRGHAVRTTQPDLPEGVAQGVSAEGALMVQTAAGLSVVSSGEVSVRLNDLAGRANEAGAAPTEPPGPSTVQTSC